jgi:hypothetical protein
MQIKFKKQIPERKNKTTFKPVTYINEMQEGVIIHVV